MAGLADRTETKAETGRSKRRSEHSTESTGRSTETGAHQDGSRCSLWRTSRRRAPSPPGSERVVVSGFGGAAFEKPNGKAAFESCLGDQFNELQVKKTHEDHE